MIDMRAEEETILQPHSQVRHEVMHNQYNKMKEEEDHWQDVSVSVSFSSLFWPSIHSFLNACEFFSAYIL